MFKAEHVLSAQRWAMSPKGQHVELGIAENNLFIFLAALGLAHDLFGARLFPIGVLYDPFIERGLDALNYACYQDARFILVATPSGITLAPEGGAHQSIGTPLIGMAQDGLAAFEPAFVDELAVILAWAFDYLQRDGNPKDSSWLREAHGGSVYLRLSTRALDQPARTMTDALRKAIIAGGYWLKPPGPGAELAIVYQGVVAPQALAVYEQILEDIPDAGLLAVTSADRLNAGWQAAQRARYDGPTEERAAVEELLAPLAAECLAGDGDRRPPGDTGLARRRLRPPRAGAGRRAFRAVGRRHRPASRLPHRRGCDPRCRRRGLSRGSCV